MDDPNEKLHATFAQLRALTRVMQIKATVACAHKLLTEASVLAHDYAHTKREWSGDAVDAIASAIDDVAASLQTVNAALHKITEEQADGAERVPYYVKPVGSQRATSVEDCSSDWAVYGPGDLWIASFKDESKANGYAEKLNSHARTQA